MFSAQRLALLSIAAAALPLLAVGNAMAGGAFNPPTYPFRVTGPAVSASIVMDAHDGVSFPNRDGGSTPAQASIRLSKGNLRSGAVFTIESPEQLFHSSGCDASRTELRFVTTSADWRPLYTWMPFAIYTQIFSDLGIAVDGAVTVAIITDIDNPACTTDPTNPGPATPEPGQPTPLAGTLSFDATIQFAIPK